MYNFEDLAFIPRIGDVVHYHPDDETRLAALVVETHPAPRDEDSQEVPRPNLALQVFHPNGEIDFLNSVSPVDLSQITSGEPYDPSGRWSQRDEIAILQNAEDGETTGTNGNFHVGFQE